MHPYLIPLGLTLLAGLSTGIGGLSPFFIKEFKRSHLSALMGFAAGVMIYISFAELLEEAVEGSSFLNANLAFFGGILGMYLLDHFLPHHYLAEQTGLAARIDPEGAGDESEILSAGLLTALGIFLHNLPEGVIIFLSALHDPRLGLVLAAAVALHHIPWGVSVAMPIYYATGDRGRAFLYALGTGMAGPIGALATVLIFGRYLTPGFINLSLAFVAGILVFIGFHELLPLAHRTEHPETASAGVVLGMIVMFVTLLFL